MLDITLISQKSSILREWRGAFYNFSEIKILKNSIFRQKGWKILEVGSNGLMSKEVYKHYKNLYISKEITNCDFFHVSDKNIVAKEELIIVPTSISKDATYGYSTYIPMLKLLVFLASFKKKKTLYIGPLGELNPVTESKIASDMLRAYKDFLEMKL